MAFLWRGKTRLYFNAHEEAPLVWSIDRGDLSTEFKTANVEIDGIARAVVNLSGPQPRAWIEFPHSTVYGDQHKIRISG